MAKEFLQKHFINEAKAAINRWSGSGGTAPDPVIQPLTVTENGTYAAPDGVDGYSPISVEIASTGGTDERFKHLIEGTITEVSDDTVTSVVNYAFRSRSRLTSINLPLVTSVGSSAFDQCSQLTSINLPLVTSVGIYAFSGCSNLTSIDLPLVTSVGNNVFYGCSKLTSINLPLVTSVDGNAFYNCSQLTSIDLPSVTSVDNFAFSGCSKLSCVIFRTETVCALSNTNAFNSTPFASGKAGGTLLIPRSLTTEYPNATNWSVVISQNANNRVLALEDYTVDGTTTGEIEWDKLNGGATV